MDLLGVAVDQVSNLGDELSSGMGSGDIQWALVTFNGLAQSWYMRRVRVKSVKKPSTPITSVQYAYSSYGSK